MIVEKERSVIDPRTSAVIPTLWDDPLDDDRGMDERADVTRRGMLRLAVAAARTGARFARDGLEVDPVAWLLAPRTIFDGETAMEACIDLAPFRRCLALHAPGADLGLDAEPDEVDEILCGSEESADLDVMRQRRGGPGRGMPFSLPDTDNGTGADAGPRLYSCSMMRVEPGARVATFVAGVASDEREFRQRLFERYGAMVALSSDVRIGFDQYDPIAASLVSERLADWLAVLAADPACRVEVSFNVVVEHRISA